MLKTFRLAGVSYSNAQQNIENLYQDHRIDESTGLTMVRERHNKFDKNAIAVEFHEFNNEYHLGYVPQNIAKELASLIDSGKNLHMKITDFITYHGSVANLNVAVTNNDD